MDNKRNNRVKELRMVLLAVLILLVGLIPVNFAYYQEQDGLALSFKEEVNSVLGVLDSFPSITGFAVEDIYEFVVPESEPLVPIPPGENETLFGIPDLNETKDIEIPITEPLLQLPVIDGNESRELASNISSERYSDMVFASNGLPDGNFTIVGKNFIYNDNGTRVSLNLSAVVAGSEYQIYPQRALFDLTQGNNWKFGGNFTIPAGPVGTFIVNNLEEINFKILGENATLEQFGLGFRYIRNCISDTFSTTCSYVEFDFSDIKELFSLNNITLPINVEKNSDTSFNISMDFTSITLTPGQVLSLDPSVTIVDVSVTNAVKTNITAENNFTHLSIGNESIDFINDNNLVLYMPFDVNNTTPGNRTYDYSKNNNDGTIIGDAIFNNSGVIGGAFVFDGIGTDRIQISSLNHPDTNLTTISVWIKPGTAGNAAGGRIIDISGAGLVFYFNSNDGDLRFARDFNTSDGVWRSGFAVNFS